MGTNLMEPKALDFLAKKVANSNRGDARAAISQASAAVHRSYDSLSPKDLTSVTSGYLVLMKHVAPILTEHNKEYSDRIKGLPDHGKSVLCILTVLSSNKVRGTSFSKLRSFVLSCLEEGGLVDALSEQDFKVVMDMLHDAGLICLGDDRLKKSSSTMTSLGQELGSMPVSIGRQAQDIAKAVQNVLGNQSFFKRLLTTTQQSIHEFRESID